MTIERIVEYSKSAIQSIGSEQEPERQLEAPWTSSNESDSINSAATYIGGKQENNSRAIKPRKKD